MADNTPTTPNPKEHFDIEPYSPPKKSLWKAIKEDPLPPLGVGVTAIILTAGMFSMFSGNKKLSQNLMRARIAAQAVTIGITVVSIQYATMKKQQKQPEGESPSQ